MRPLTLSLLSGATSIAFGMASRTFLTNIDLSQATSPNTFTHLLISFFCLLATLAGIWICLSYLLLAYVQRTHHHSTSALLRRAARLTTPHVRRHLLAAMTLSLVMAQPAYAQDYENAPNNSPIDISWGSPDLLEITEHPLSLSVSPPSPTPLPTTYTIKSGDTLWDIAKTYLPPDATDSDIAQACLVWSAANPTIKNPNLIYPGQILTIPQEKLS